MIDLSYLICSKWWHKAASKAQFDLLFKCRSISIADHCLHFLKSSHTCSHPGGVRPSNQTCSMVPHRHVLRTFFILLFEVWECLMEDTAKSVIYVRLPAALVLGQSWKACHQIIQDPKITYVLRLPYSNITYRVFIKYCVFSLKYVIFLNSARSAAALVSVCVHPPGR